MNKQELIVKLMGKTKAYVTHADMERIVNGLLSEIKTAVAEGDTVQLIGFGTFESRKREARTARNPQTGEMIQIEAKTVPAFKPGAAFKEMLK